MTPGPAAVVDAHVHLHERVELAAFLDGAWRNLLAAAAAAGVPLAEGHLLLAQTAGNDRFERLAAAALPAGDTPPGPGGWSVHRCAEPESLLARRGEEARLVLVSGRQVRTREGLEVLALATCRRFEDGRPVARVLADAGAAGAIAVLPWGVGKWLGRRGQIVRRLIETGGTALCCGDVANRPSLWPTPRLLRLARRRGLRVLRGSDPLPLPSEAERAGRFGFALAGPLSPERPAADLRRRLADPATPLTDCGRLESPWRFLRNQAALRLRGSGG